MKSQNLNFLKIISILLIVFASIDLITVLTNTPELYELILTKYIDIGSFSAMLNYRLVFIGLLTLQFFTGISCIKNWNNLEPDKVSLYIVLIIVIFSINAYFDFPYFLLVANSLLDIIDFEIIITLLTFILNTIVRILFLIGAIKVKKLNHSVREKIVT